MLHKNCIYAGFIQKGGLLFCVDDHVICLKSLWWEPYFVRMTLKNHQYELWEPSKISFSVFVFFYFSCPDSSVFLCYELYCQDNKVFRRLWDLIFLERVSIWLQKWKAQQFLKSKCQNVKVAQKDREVYKNIVHAQSIFASWSWFFVE